MPAETLPYLDPTLPLEERCRDLIARLTLDEKISLMENRTPGIPRLGIPAYDYWSEALHGVGRNGLATVFPQAISLAASWDPDLIRRISSAIGDEGRAKYHAALRRSGSTGMYQGLTFWSPNVNIFRDPRWGRGQETWGEDPYLTGEMGSAFVRGLQGDHPRYLKTAACAKHYAVHSGPEKLRHEFDARVSLRDLYATYLPAFKKLVTEAGVEAVMGAYNRVNGEPCCASPTLLQKILRQEWGFAGHVVSDCWALCNIFKDHKVAQDAAEAAGMALKAGCDLSCMEVYDHLGEAIARGLITEEDIDRSLARTLATRFKLGMFDPPEMVPFASIPLEVVNCEAHRALAREAAVKSIVLLKNKGGLLPIKDSTRSVAVVGPTAADMMVLLGNYYGLNPHMKTLLEGIVERAPEGMRLYYRQGVQLLDPTRSNLEWSVGEAAAADLVVACMGISPLMEGEEGESILTASLGDRDEPGLPAVQMEYLKKLHLAGAKIVLVITGGSPVTLGDAYDWAQAVVWVGYPGEEGGTALAQVLFGDICPSGRLTVTTPKSWEQLPPFTDYAMTGRTYRYAEWEPEFPFGFGLSYTRFAYTSLLVTPERAAVGEPVTVRVQVTNTGDRDGDETVQVYLKDVLTSGPAPLWSLVGFQRVALRAGESKTVEMEIPAEAMALVQAGGQAQIEPGEFRVQVGGCAPGPRGQQLGAPAAVHTTFHVG